MPENVFTPLNICSSMSDRDNRIRFWSWYLWRVVFSLFDVENMEDGMKTQFKINLLSCGRTIFFRDNDGELRCMYFTDAGEVPVYCQQIVRMRVVNPVLGEFTFNYGDDDNSCIYLTTLDRIQFARGFSDAVLVYAEDLAENDLSTNMVQFIKRLPLVFVGKTDNSYLAISNMLERVKKGDKAIAVQSPMTDLISKLDGEYTGSVSLLSEFTEYQQYKVGQFYNMLGVNMAWNLKRQLVSAAEIATSAETARFNIADLIFDINQQLEDVNKKFGTSFKAVPTIEKAAELSNTLEGVATEDINEDATESSSDIKDGENIDES